MALYLLRRSGTFGSNIVDGTEAMIVEADSEATAKRVATAQTHGDAEWSGSTATVIAAGVASDYEGFVYRVKVGSDPQASWAPDLFDVSYTAVSSDTVDLIGAALANLLCGTAVEAAIADDGSSYTDETTAANNATTNDMNILPATPAENDAYLIGMSDRFDRVLFNVTTAGVGTYTMTWQYWDGDSWEDLSGVTDDTGHFKTTGLNDVVWTLPSDWAMTTVNSQGPFYYVRAIVDDGTCTTTPLAGQAWTREGLRSSYVAGSNTLTVAATADGIGDHSLAIEASLPDAVETLSDLVGTVTDGGASGDALTVVFEDETAIPAILAQL